MLRIDDKDPLPIRDRINRRYRPLHKRLRLYWFDDDNKIPVWKWRGILFKHNKRKKPMHIHS